MMKNYSRISVYLATGLIALLLSACCQGSKGKAGTVENKMLLDKSATPAQHTLIRLQERPVFQLDDKKRPFAMIDDRNDKIRAGDKPITIRELKSK